MYTKDLKLLSSNIALLMKRSGHDSQLKLAAATGVSQAQIGNILRCEKSPTVSTLSRLAAGLRCETWQLLAPTQMLERGMDQQFNDLLNAYLAADENGRATILSVAHSFGKADTR